jgi:hypothetical protein
MNQIILAAEMNWWEPIPCIALWLGICLCLLLFPGIWKRISAPLNHPFFAGAKDNPGCLMMTIPIMFWITLGCIIVFCVGWPVSYGLHKLGLHPNYNGGRSPLMDAAASKKSRTKVCEELIEAGAEVNATDNNNQSPLMLAAANNNPEICAVLIKAGAEVNATDNNNRSPLMIAAWKSNNSEVCAVLIKAGAEVNATDNEGVSPLIDAAAINTAEVCTVLIEAGAEINAIDKEGKKAIHYAKDNPHLKDTDVYWQLHDASFE